MRRALLLVIVVLAAQGAVRAEEPPIPDACVAGGDAGGGPESAAPLPLETICDGWNDDGGDWYAVDLAEGVALDIRLETSLSSDMLLCVHGPDGVWDRCGVRYTYTTRDAGRHFFTFLDGFRDQYTMLVHVWPQDDCRSGRDAPGGLANAVRIYPDDACSGAWFSQDDPVDAYGIEVKELAPLRIGMASEFRHTGRDRACLLAPTGETIGCVGSTTNGAQTQYAPTQHGRHHLVVTPDPDRSLPDPDGGIPAAYILNVALEQTPQDDCASGGDAGDTPERALVLGRAASCAGVHRGYSDPDVYAIPVAALDVVRLRSSVPLCVVAETGSDLGCATSFMHEATSAGRLLLEADGAWNATYSFSVDARSPDDCGGGRDTSLAAPLRILTPRACAGAFLLRADVEDAFVFDALGPGELRARLADAPTGASVCIVDPTGAEVACGADAVANVSAGGWGLRVRSTASDDVRAYALQIAYGPGGPDCLEGRDTGAADAPLLSPPIACWGTGGAGDSTDEFSFAAASGTTLRTRVTVTHATGSFCFDSAGVGQTCGVTARPERPVLYTHVAATDGVHRLRMIMGSASPLAYSLDMTASPPADACGSGRDAGTGAGAPELVEPVMVCAGSVATSADPADEYVLRLGALGSALVELRGGSALRLCVAPETGGEARCSDAPAVEAFPLSGGDWRIRVDLASVAAAQYELVVVHAP